MATVSATKCSGRITPPFDPVTALRSVLGCHWSRPVGAMSVLRCRLPQLTLEVIEIPSFQDDSVPEKQLEFDL
jgi:hypothetical protein